MIPFRSLEHAHLRMELPRMISVLGLGGALGCALWQLHLSLPLRDRPESAPRMIASVLPVRAERASGFTTVAELHLFGLYRPPVEAAPPPVIVREASPDFRLQGVFTSRDDVDAAALIAVGAGVSARRFEPGDSISEGTELVSIALDHVVLRRDGELQRLSLHQAHGASGSGTASTRKRTRLAMHLSREGRSTTSVLGADPGRASVVMARLRRLRAGGN